MASASTVVASDGATATSAAAPAVIAGPVSAIVRRRRRSAHSAPPSSVPSVVASVADAPAAVAAASESPTPPAPAVELPPMAPRVVEPGGATTHFAARLPSPMLPLRRSNSLGRGLVPRRRTSSASSRVVGEIGEVTSVEREPASSSTAVVNTAPVDAGCGGSAAAGASESVPCAGFVRPKNSRHTLPALPVAATRCFPRGGSRNRFRPVNALAAAAVAAVSGYNSGGSGRRGRASSWGGPVSKTVPETLAPNSEYALPGSAAATTRLLAAPGSSALLPPAQARQSPSVDHESHEHPIGGALPVRRSSSRQASPARSCNSDGGDITTCSKKDARDTNDSNINKSGTANGNAAGNSRSGRGGYNSCSSAVGAKDGPSSGVPPLLPRSALSSANNGKQCPTKVQAKCDVGPSLNVPSEAEADTPQIGSPPPSVPSACSAAAVTETGEHNEHDLGGSASARLAHSLCRNDCGGSDQGSWGSASLSLSSPSRRSPPLSPLGTAQKHMRSQPPKGLQNLGNTCFLNAALQALAHAPLLSPYFLQGHFVRDLNAANPLGSGGMFATAFAELLHKLYPREELSNTTSIASTLGSSSSSSFSPDDFYNVVCRCCALVGEQRGEQQDAHEVMNFLLDLLHEDLNRTRKRPPYQEKPDLIEEDLSRRGEERFAAEAWHDHLQRHRSVLVDLCQGQLRSQVRCSECGRMSVTFDPFLFLSLPLPAGLKRGGKASIEEAIRAFCAEEKLDGDNRWLCPRCKKRVGAYKRLSLWKLPVLLLVHLKRFGFEAASNATAYGEQSAPRAWKIEGEVTLPFQRMDLQDVMAAPSPQRVPLLYDLFAAVDHVGATASVGHYTAACRRADGWWRFDDSRTEFLGRPDDGAESRVLGEGNYLLLFQRRDAPPEPDLVREQSHKLPENWPHVQGDVEWSFLNKLDASTS